MKGWALAAGGAGALHWAPEQEHKRCDDPAPMLPGATVAACAPAKVLVAWRDRGRPGRTAFSASWVAWRCLFSSLFLRATCYGTILSAACSHLILALCFQHSLNTQVKKHGLQSPQSASCKAQSWCDITATSLRRLPPLAWRPQQPLCRPAPTAPASGLPAAEP